MNPCAPETLQRSLTSWVLMAAKWVELAEQVRTGAVSLAPFGPRAADQCLANARVCEAEASRIRRLLLAAGGSL